jgi:hypothetical protein
MPTSVAQKLKIKEGSTLRTVNAPADFKKKLEGLPAAVKISTEAKDYQQVHWFVLNKAQMEKEINAVLKLIKDEVVCWIYYPKVSSKIQTDLTRDNGWDSLLKHKDLQWISLIAFDDTWSTFGFRRKTEADRKKEAKPKERPIFDYIDPKQKTIRLPEDFQTVLRKNKKQKEFFDTLSFTNRKEYVEWIVTAKREETRNERIKGSVERLAKGWKNPRNM